MNTFDISTKQMSKSAIITADIVNSTNLGPALEKRLKEQITEAIKPNKLEFYRGDSFQALVKKPGEALSIALRTRAIARTISSSHDVRASIGIGFVSPNTKKLSAANDEAFIYSGRAFDIISKTDKRLIIHSKNEIANHGFQVICSFADFLFRPLTEKQAEVFSVLLSNKTQLETARMLKKSQSTINKHVQSAGWHELLGILHEYEELVAKL